MLSVNSLDNICRKAVADVIGLEKHFLVISESHLAKRLRGLKAHESPILVAILPTAQGQSANVDTLLWQNQLMFLVLKGPVNYTARAVEAEVEDFNFTQKLTLDFIDYLRTQQTSGQCTILKKLDLNSLQVDPEYNFHSCDGWSITLNLDTSQWTQTN